MPNSILEINPLFFVASETAEDGLVALEKRPHLVVTCWGWASTIQLILPTLEVGKVFLNRAIVLNFEVTSQLYLRQHSAKKRLYNTCIL